MSHATLNHRSTGHCCTFVEPEANPLIVAADCKATKSCLLDNVAVTGPAGTIQLLQRRVEVVNSEEHQQLRAGIVRMQADVHSDDVSMLPAPDPPETCQPRSAP